MSYKPNSEKLQKVLARAGIGSRREMERWIADGRIRVNDQIANLGIRVNDDDQIKVNGRIIKKHLSAGKKTATQMIMYNKPAGEICTRNDPQKRKTVFSSLPKPLVGRWIGVGRLDINTSGLMLFTNNGELANKLMHPSSKVDREYAVRVYGTASPEQLEQLLTGVKVENSIIKFDDVVDNGGEGRNHWYHVVLHEGKNHEIRKTFAALDLPVSRLIRVRYGPFLLANLFAGKTKQLTVKDIQFLNEYLEKCLAN